MTTYETVQEREGPFEAWAVIARGDDGAQRFVSRLMSRDQALTMVDRLEAMAAAEKVG
jgi:hypothetical protein